MSETQRLNGGTTTAMQVVVPTTVYEELMQAFSQDEINDAVVESLKDSLRKRRFHRDLARGEQRKAP
ncbi:MAG: hypothetical protein ABIO65_02345 [Nitrospiria bacterium]